MAHFPSTMSAQESDALADRFETGIDERGWGIWAVERKEDGASLGFVGLAPVTFEADFTPAVEVGWRLDRPYWGHGYGGCACVAGLRLHGARPRACRVVHGPHEPTVGPTGHRGASSRAPRPLRGARIRSLGVAPPPLDTAHWTPRTHVVVVRRAHEHAVGRGHGAAGFPVCGQAVGPPSHPRRLKRSMSRATATTSSPIPTPTNVAKLPIRATSHEKF